MRNGPDMQVRLVQQLARIGKLEDEIKADLRANKEKAWRVIQTCDMQLERLRPMLEKWIEANFDPDTRRLRKAARLYIALIQRRQDALFADGIAEKHLTGAEGFDRR